jgi:hypothetical protein
MSSDLIVNCLPHLITEKSPRAFALCGVTGLLNIGWLLTARSRHRGQGTVTASIVRVLPPRSALLDEVAALPEPGPELLLVALQMRGSRLP